MSVLDKARTLPRSAVSMSITAARLPLTAFESMARRGQDNTEWPPAVAFEGVEATVRQTMGTLLRDEVLVEEGRLRKAKVAQLKKAAQLKAEAEAERLAAQADLQERREQAESERRAVEQRTAEREQQLEQQREQKVDKVRKQAAQRKQQARKAQAVVEDALDKTERSAKLTALDAEAEALEAQREALARQSDVIELDQSIDQVKELRSARS